MAVSVEKLAGQLNLPPKRLIALLDAAGITGKNIDHEVSQDEKSKLLRYMHKGRYQGSPKGSKQKIQTTGRTGSKREIVVEIKGGPTVAPRRIDRSVIAKLRKPTVPVQPKAEEETQKAEPEVKQDIPDTAQPAAQKTEQAPEPKEKPAEAIDEKSPAAAEELPAEVVAEKQEPAAEPTEEAKPQEDVKVDEEQSKAAPESKPSEPKSKAKREKAKRKAKKPTQGQQTRLRLPARVIKFEQEQARRRQFRERRQQQHQFTVPQEPRTLEVEISESNSVIELAKSMSVKASSIIQKLFELGETVTINDRVDKDTAIYLVEELGHVPKEIEVKDIESSLIQAIDDKREFLHRTPVVVVMGHVDHGKTTLLDTIRKTQVVKSEKGGITQHIGAYIVKTNKGKITFLDTPGHEAFAAMRVRGSKVTDIVILVVAADDGVKPQTIESINHAKNADVPIIVAINKIDSNEANPSRVLRQLTEHGIIAEELGGDVLTVEVSALKKIGIDDLLECINLQAELLELKAPRVGPASGVVIEARVDVGRGVIATVLINKGTLKRGDVVVAGVQKGKVRALKNDRGSEVRSGGPSVPLEIQGLKEVPVVGDQFLVVPNEKSAKELVEFRLNKTEKTTNLRRTDVYFGTSDEPLVINVLVKSDVQGSAEAITNAIKNLSTDRIEVKVIHGMVGGISQSDVNLALTTDAIIIAFNVRADAIARQMIDENKINVIYSGVIYDALDALKEIISGMIEPETVEEIIARVEVRDVFKLSKGGTIAGCFVADGTVRDNASLRVLRNNVVIHNGVIDSLRRYKNNVTEVKAGMECGIMIRNYHDVTINDELEVFQVRHVS